MSRITLNDYYALAAQKDNAGSLSDRKASYVPSTVRKAISQTSRDITDLQNARRLATAVADPKQHLLQDIFALISDDAHLSSQINNRKEQTISAPFEMLLPGEGKLDEKMTQILTDLPVITELIGYQLDSENFNHSLVELSVERGMPKVQLINRRNVVPEFGRFYPDITQSKYINYREAREYGRWLLEFNSGHLGLLNKAIPHALFKRFAQSCWSELCEIYGIPPRVMKTDTRDPIMLSNAEKMMRDIGAAAWFIIDSTEEFEFAKGADTNGDVYNNLIRLCNNEMSMLVSGAIVGQDTENGNESKEKVSMTITDRLVQSDKRMVEIYMNTVVIPALYRIGWIPQTSSIFKFAAAENKAQLFEMTVKIMPHKKVSDAFIKEKFGIEVEGDRFEQQPGSENFQ